MRNYTQAFSRSFRPLQAAENRSTTPSPIASVASTQTSVAGSPCGTTGDRNTPPATSKARSRGSGIQDGPAFAGEPPCNGCAERFIRTLKEQCLWARLYENVEDLRHAVIEFTRRYNHEWLIERHGHCAPREAYAAAMESKAA